MGLALRPVNEQAQTFEELATKAHDIEVMIANTIATLLILLSQRRTKLNSGRILISLKSQLNRQCLSPRLSQFGL